MGLRCHYLSKFRLKFLWNHRHNCLLESTQGLRLLSLNASSLFHFPITEIHGIVRGKFSGHWQCVTCNKKRFFWNSLDNREIVKESLKSNFECKSQIASNYLLGQEEFVFKYQSGDTKWEKQYSSITDESDNMILLQPNFKHYQNHDFHRLSKGFKGSKIFSLLHTNICSLRGNFENLQNLINNLDHSFSLILVSEAWTPKWKNEQFNPKTLEDYQKYYGI